MTKSTGKIRHARNAALLRLPRSDFDEVKRALTDVCKLFNSELSPEHLAVLQQTKIDERLTGPLLTNIETMIDAIGMGIETTSAYFALPQRVLMELNEAMVDPLPHDLTRPQLGSFPTLMGLFMLLRGSGLAVGGTKPKRRVLIDPGMLA